MPATSAPTLRICCVAAAFFLAIANAAEPPHPLIGATREQVLSRMGEPKSQISLGNRIVYLYARERVILRDDVVIEVEPLLIDATRRPPSTETAGAAPGTASTVPAPASPTTPVTDERTQPGTPAAGTALNPTAGSDSKVEIKLVRPPSANYSRPAPTKPENAPPNVAPPSVTFTPEVPALTKSPKAGAGATPAAPTAPTVKADEAASAAETAQAERLAAEAAAKEMKAKAIAASRRRLADAKPQESPDSVISSELMIAVLVVMVGGIGFVIWRWRQRQLELAATTVMNTPVSTSVTTPPIPPARGAGFTEDYLSQLDPTRFEILVAAYYNKTGVVAVRSKASPGAVTQIRISWKGEPKPFAGVLCVAHPVGAIEAKALGPMVAELGADDIRRGHIVTTGKFTAAARQFAAEKHLTLFPLEVFLEKLNALPESARKEIMQAVTTGDPVAPA